MHKTRVKLCGITCRKDALLAAQLGADALGFVFTESRRRIDPEEARDIIAGLPPFIITVGVFMDQPMDEVNQILRITGVDRAQLHGSEPPDYCRRVKCRVVKSIRVRPEDSRETLLDRMRPYTVSGFVLDPGAGSGQTFDWHIARDLPQPILLAGGLTPENVKDAIQVARPFGVDVSSGIESAPGKKDAEKMKRFFKEIE